LAKKTGGRPENGDFTTANGDYRLKRRGRKEIFRKEKGNLWRVHEPPSVFETTATERERRKGGGKKKKKIQICVSEDTFVIRGQVGVKANKPSTTLGNGLRLGGRRDSANGGFQKNGSQKNGSDVNREFTRNEKTRIERTFFKTTLNCAQPGEKGEGKPGKPRKEPGSLVSVGGVRSGHGEVSLQRISGAEKRLVVTRGRGEWGGKGGTCQKKKGV